MFTCVYELPRKALPIEVPGYAAIEMPRRGLEAAGKYPISFLGRVAGGQAGRVQGWEAPERARTGLRSHSGSKADRIPSSEVVPAA